MIHTFEAPDVLGQSLGIEITRSKKKGIHIVTVQRLVGGEAEGDLFRIELLSEEAADNFIERRIRQGEFRAKKNLAETLRLIDVGMLADPRLEHTNG